MSAAFILISSKVGDLFGRKRAFVVGMVFYAVGALAMVFAQGLTAVIVFWAILGGLGASLYLPAMQSLIHGNFEGKTRAKVFALVGASGAIAAAIGPLIGGFVTTLLSWRVGFLVEALIIAVVLLGSRGIRDVPYSGDRSIDITGAFLSVIGMGGPSWGSSRGRRAASPSRCSSRSGRLQSGGLVYWLVRRKRQGKPTLLDPTLFASKLFSNGVAQIMLQQVALGGLLIALPIYLQLVWGYNALEAGVTLAPLSLTMFGVALLAGRRAGRRRASSIIRAGFVLLFASIVLLILLVPRADSGWHLVIPLMLAGAGLGLLASQLNNYALSPISEERVGEAAGVTSATGSFGLSFGLAFAGAVMLATLSISFTNMAESSSILPPADQQRVADVLEDDAQVMSDAQLGELLAGQPEPVHTRSSASTPTSEPRAPGCFARLAARGARRRRHRIPDGTRLPDPAQSADSTDLGLG